MQMLRWPGTAANNAFCSPFSFREKLELVKSNFTTTYPQKALVLFHLLVELRNKVSTIYVQSIVF